MKTLPNVTLGQLADAGINPYAVQMLAESYAKHPNPVAVAFTYESQKDGKPIAVSVRLAPTDDALDSYPCDEGLSMIRQERIRQVDSEGWTPEHDDQHVDGEMADAAAYYAYHRPAVDAGNGDGTDDISAGDSVLRLLWPHAWHHDWAKKSGKDRVRQLVVAGALIVAELERLMRAAAAEDVRQQQRAEEQVERDHCADPDQSP